VNLDGYVPVHDRLLMALNAHPDLRVVEVGHQIVQLGDRAFIEATVEVYRTADDPRPSRGTVWEPFPGRTAFQKDSELMVAYTSALGRALGYMGHGIERGMASVDEIRNRTEPEGGQITRSKPGASKAKAIAGSMAARASEEVPPPPEDPAPVTRGSGRRKEPTEKMLAFLERLNTERGNPLSPQDVARAAADFDVCRERIDELQALPKD